MRDELDAKASMTDLSNLHSNMMDKLNELMNNLENVFADKDQTRKKLAALEKALKQLHEMIKGLEGMGQTEQANDAMFTKKYVGPVDCASCDKNITNLNGLRADQVSWNRLPFREPAERIAKYGAGFSRFLQATSELGMAHPQKSGQGSYQDLGQNPEQTVRHGEQYASPPPKAGRSLMKDTSARDLRTKRTSYNQTITHGGGKTMLKPINNLEATLPSVKYSQNA